VVLMLCWSGHVVVAGFGGSMLSKRAYRQVLHKLSLVHNVMQPHKIKCT
jgi:hypothetical protein